MAYLAGVVSNGSGRMVGDSDTGRAQQAVGLLTSGSRVIRSLAQCSTTPAVKRWGSCHSHRRRWQRSALRRYSPVVGAWVFAPVSRDAFIRPYRTFGLGARLPPGF